jgi:hypothetical protein
MLLQWDQQNLSAAPAVAATQLKAPVDDSAIPVDGTQLQAPVEDATIPAVAPPTRELIMDHHRLLLNAAQKLFQLSILNSANEGDTPVKDQGYYAQLLAVGQLMPRGEGLATRVGV